MRASVRLCAFTETTRIYGNCVVVVWDSHICKIAMTDGMSEREGPSTVRDMLKTMFQQIRNNGRLTCVMCHVFETQ